jgi:hypothetical protein
MESLIERSPKTVDDLIAHRHEPRTYEEKMQHALDVVTMHLQEENPERIDECIRLYTEDAVWEAPARLVSYQGRETIKKMYLKVFNGVENSYLRRLSAGRLRTACSMIRMPPSALSGDAFENCPLPIGTKVKMRLIHNFHIRDGLIAREVGYEVWRRAE